VRPETDKLFAGSVPENYDRYLVPLIFEGFAEDLARRVASFSPNVDGVGRAHVVPRWQIALGL
jgi:hypothetical protein